MVGGESDKKDNQKTEIKPCFLTLFKIFHLKSYIFFN